MTDTVIHAMQAWYTPWKGGWQTPGRSASALMGGAKQPGRRTVRRHAVGEHGCQYKWGDGVSYTPVNFEHERRPEGQLERTMMKLETEGLPTSTTHR